MKRIRQCTQMLHLVAFKYMLRVDSAILPKRRSMVTSHGHQMKLKVVYIRMHGSCQKAFKAKWCCGNIVSLGNHLCSGFYRLIVFFMCTIPFNVKLMGCIGLGLQRTQIQLDKEIRYVCIIKLKYGALGTPKALRL